MNIEIGQTEESWDIFVELPEESFQHVLSFLSCEEIDKLRSVNLRFNDTCSYLLKKAYRHVKQEVFLCCERARLRLAHYDEDFKCCTFSGSEYFNRIFWFAVSQMLDTSFCLFDYLKGYLDEKYSVNGKTIDVVRRILIFKDMEDPSLFLIEATIGRGEDTSKMKYFDDWGHAYIYWYNVKKYHGQEVKTIYVPLFDKTQPGLELPTYCASQKTFMYTHTLDILSTLWMEEVRMEKHHLLIPELSTFNSKIWDAKKNFVLKPGQDENPMLYIDSDPIQLDIARQWKEYDSGSDVTTSDEESSDEDSSEED